ncbi:hypothetical protein BD769DRAFT_1346345, partial [Suillus cothurnatus]
TNQPVGDPVLHDNDSEVWAVAMSPNGKYIVSGALMKRTTNDDHVSVFVHYHLSFLSGFRLSLGIWMRAIHVRLKASRLRFLFALYLTSLLGTSSLIDGFCAISCEHPT